MSFQLHTSDRQTAEVLSRALGLETCPPSERRFELLRATVWSLRGPEAKAHINSVLNSALPAWRILSERAAASQETLRAELRVALSTLDDAGDLIGLSGGYWAPAVARLVTVPDGGGDLLVGGVPSTVLLASTEAVEFHGPHRHLARVPPELAALSFEPFMSWARVPGCALQDWAHELTESMELEPYSPTNADDFEFYLPENSKHTAPQFLRWFGSAENLSGTFLARRRRIYGARECRLVEVRSGRITSSCELHGVDVRRLMYAFDLAAKNPVRARYLGDEQSRAWMFTSELPRAEQRAFAAFGTLTIPEDRPYERRWTFVRNYDVVLGMLRALGIELGQQPREER